MTSTIQLPNPGAKLSKSLVLVCCEAPELPGPPGDGSMDHGDLHLVPTGYYAKLKNINGMGNYLCMSEKTWQNWKNMWD